jgi:hypothetical protein
MQLAGEAAPIQSFATAAFAENAPTAQPSVLSQYKVIRRSRRLRAGQDQRGRDEGVSGR